MLLFLVVTEWCCVFAYTYLVYTQGFGWVDAITLSILLFLAVGMTRDYIRT